MNKDKQLAANFNANKAADPKNVDKMRTCMARFKIVKNELAEI